MFCSNYYVLMHGVLVANEVVASVKRHSKKLLLFKVDFAKAFDCVNWKFFYSIMAQMQFNDKWRKWIIGCISSPSIEVLVNGSPTHEFFMERGLRQGDPLSPFLFTIIGEALAIMMKEATLKGIFKPCKVRSYMVEDTRLQFADDVLFFGD